MKIFNTLFDTFHFFKLVKDNQQQRIVLLSEKSVIRIWKRQNEASDEVSNDLIYFGIVSSPRDIFGFYEVFFFAFYEMGQRKGGSLDKGIEVTLGYW